MAMHVFSQGDLISIAQFDLDQHQNISSPQTECNSLLSLCPYIKQYRASTEFLAGVTGRPFHTGMVSPSDEVV
jgi:hypothetical protein